MGEHAGGKEPSTPSGNPYPAIIQLRREIRSEYARHIVTYLDGNA